MRVRAYVCDYIDVNVNDVLAEIKDREMLEEAIRQLEEQLAKCTSKGSAESGKEQVERGRIDLQNWVRMAAEQGWAASMTLRARDFLARAGVYV